MAEFVVFKAVGKALLRKKNERISKQGYLIRVHTRAMRSKIANQTPEHRAQSANPLTEPAVVISKRHANSIAFMPNFLYRCVAPVCK